MPKGSIVGVVVAALTAAGGAPSFSQAGEGVAAKSSSTKASAAAYARVRDVANSHIPLDRAGYAAIVVKGGEIAELTAGNAYPNAPFTLDTPCRIGSVSKLITAWAVMELVRTGKVRVDAQVLPFIDPTGTIYIPVDRRVSRITVEQLLWHRGGFGGDESALFDQFNAAKAVGASRTPLSPELQLRYFLGKTSLVSEPGTTFQYSNPGYLLLGQVVERGSGMPYEQFVRQKLFAPLGIDGRIGSCYLGKRQKNEATYLDLAPRTTSFVSIYSENRGQTVAFPDGAYALESMGAHGGWVMSAHALYILFKHLQEQLAKDTTLQRLLTPPPGANPESYYGFGTYCSARNGIVNAIWHSGSVDGASALVRIDGDGDMLVFVCNVGVQNPPVADRVASAVRPLLDDAMPSDSRN